MSRLGVFELHVVPVGDVELGIELVQEPKGRSTEARRIVAVRGTRLQAMSDHLFEALRQGGYRPSDLRRNRTKPFLLQESSGVRLGLVLLATKPLHKLRRVEEISSAVRIMSDDEAYYWFAKCSDAEHGHRALRAFRDLWSDR